MHAMGGMGFGGHLFDMADANHDGRVSLQEAEVRRAGALRPGRPQSRRQDHARRAATRAHDPDRAPSELSFPRAFNGAVAFSGQFTLPMRRSVMSVSEVIGMKEFISGGDVLPPCSLPPLQSLRLPPPRHRCPNGACPPAVSSRRISRAPMFRRVSPRCSISSTSTATASSPRTSSRPAGRSSTSVNPRARRSAPRRPSTGWTPIMTGRSPRRNWRLARRPGKARLESIGAAGSSLLARADSNKDGILSRAEYEAAVASGKIKSRHANMRGSALARLFDIADANKDGKVSLDEAQKAALQQFDSADVNHDGVLSPEERRQAKQERAFEAARRLGQSRAVPDDGEIDGVDIAGEVDRAVARERQADEQPAVPEPLHPCRRHARAVGGEDGGHFGGPVRPDRHEPARQAERLGGRREDGNIVPIVPLLIGGAKAERRRRFVLVDGVGSALCVEAVDQRVRTDQDEHSAAVEE